MIDKIKIALAIVLIAISIYGFYYFSEMGVLARSGMVVGSVIAALLIMLTSTQGQDAWKFMSGARTEIRKVVWPTKREAAQMTAIVIVMVIIIGTMIYFVDWLLVKIIYGMILGV